MTLRPSQRFKKFLILSAGLHAGLILVLIVGPWVASLFRKPKKFDIVTYVDLQMTARQLPDVKPLDNPVPPKPVKEMIPPPKKIPEPVKKPKEKEFLKSTERIKKTDPNPEKRLSPEEIKKLLQGGPSPLASNPDPLGALPGWYKSLVRRAMYDAWKQPSQLADISGMVAEVDLRVQRDGSVTRRELTRSSGNTIMDTSVMKAVRSVDRLKPLPPEVPGAYKDLSIDFQLAGDSYF